jgi:hypothetical protein
MWKIVHVAPKNITIISTLRWELMMLSGLGGDGTSDEVYPLQRYLSAMIFISKNQIIFQIHGPNSILSSAPPLILGTSIMQVEKKIIL